MKVFAFFNRAEGPVIFTSSKYGVPNSPVYIGDHDIPPENLDKVKLGARVELDVKVETFSVQGRNERRHHLLGISW